MARKKAVIRAGDRMDAWTLVRYFQREEKWDGDTVASILLDFLEKEGVREPAVLERLDTHLRDISTPQVMDAV